MWAASVELRLIRRPVRPPPGCSAKNAAVDASGPGLRHAVGRSRLARWRRGSRATAALVDRALRSDDLPARSRRSWAGRRSAAAWARAAAAQGNGDWAARLVDRLWPEAPAAQRPDDRLLWRRCIEALPAAQRAERPPRSAQRPRPTTAAGVERLLELCAAAVAAGLAEAFDLAAIAVWCAAARRPGGWPACALAGTRLPLALGGAGFQPGSTIRQVELLRAAFAAEPDRPEAGHH